MKIRPFFSLVLAIALALALTGTAAAQPVLPNCPVAQTFSSGGNDDSPRGTSYLAACNRDSDTFSTRYLDDVRITPA
jgi:hypothetical protein